MVELMLENDSYKIYQDEMYMYIEDKRDSNIDKFHLDDKFLLSNIADIVQGCNSNRYYNSLFKEVINEVITYRL